MVHYHHEQKTEQILRPKIKKNLRYYALTVNIRQRDQTSQDFSLSFFRFLFPFSQNFSKFLYALRLYCLQWYFPMFS